MGLFICLVVLLFNLLLKWKRDYECKNKSFKYLDNGNTEYYDSNHNHYINGEKVQTILVYGDNDRTWHRDVGVKTGTIYWDERQVLLNKYNKESETNLKFSKEWGELAYRKYNDYYRKFLTTEISTGKIIALLLKTSDGRYYKFYSKGYPELYNKICDNDLGIQISEDEYKKLDIIGGTHRKDVKIIYKDNKILLNN